MKRFAALAFAWGLVMSDAAGAQGRSETGVVLGAGSAALHGSLLKPADARATTPAVLLIAGSGPTDRDGNSPAGVRAATLKLLAEAVADRGIISLRYDKRGVAASAAAGPAEAEMRFGALVDDAVAWTAELKRRSGASCVVLAGHSEGALIAALAAAKAAHVCGVVSMAGAGRPASQILREQLGAGLPPPLLARATAMLDELQAGRTVADAPPELAALFRPSVQPYLISWLPIDPADALARAKQPALILQGSTDIQVSEADARRLAAAAPGARLVVLPGVNHVLKAAPADRAVNAAIYANPHLPLAPGVSEAVADFVLAQSRPSAVTR